MLSKIINISLLIIVVLVFYFGLMALLEIGMLEKTQIKGPATEENIISLSVESRINEFDTVSMLVMLSFVLGLVVVVKLISELFLRKK